MFKHHELRTFSYQFLVEFQYLSDENEEALNILTAYLKEENNGMSTYEAEHFVRMKVAITPE